jgi:hypothetical protein
MLLYQQRNMLAICEKQDWYANAKLCLLDWQPTECLDQHEQPVSHEFVVMR